MTQSEIINSFIEDIRSSLDEINKIYYSLHYWKDVNHMFYNREQQFAALKKYLDKYQERVFCYELYHQLRKKMENRVDNMSENTYSFRNIFLQSELTKYTIGSYLENIYNVVNLSREFMPDFLLHTPGFVDNQLIIVEVKSNPKVTSKEIKYDLRKIQEFINRYQYRQGIFIATNVDDADRDKLINKISVWAEKEINTPGQIKLIFKSSPDAIIYEKNINELIL